MTRDLQAEDEKEGMAIWNKNNAIEDLLDGWYDSEYDEERFKLSDWQKEPDTGSDKSAREGAEKITKKQNIKQAKVVRKK